MSLDPARWRYSSQSRGRAANEDETGLIDDFRLYCGIECEANDEGAQATEGIVMAATRRVELCENLHAIVMKTLGSIACAGT
jgi:hypothetical protein